MKHLKIDVHTICAASIIVVATVLRLILISQNWPGSNSDESTMGLMALHIIARGEHPIFFYGQGYMGAFEAYLAAGFFQLFGPSLFSLRFGLVVLFALFLVCMFFLTSLLYSKNLALITLSLLALGSLIVILRELRAIGGYSEMLLCDALLFLLATWLALTCGTTLTRGKKWLRLLVYGLWGLLAGFGIWTDPLTLTCIVPAGLLLLIFCWREWRSWYPLSLVTGFLTGIVPMIVYNLSVPSDQSTWDSLKKVFLASSAGQTVPHVSLSHHILATVLIGIPTATGASPLCPTLNTSSLSLSSLFVPAQFQCLWLQGAWGAGYILLLLLAAFLSLKFLWDLRNRIHPPQSTEANESPAGEIDGMRQQIIRHTARLMLLCSVMLTTLLFTLSTTSALDPYGSSRYLMGLLVATPAIISPLWEYGHGMSFHPSFNLLKENLQANLLTAFKSLLLLLLGIVLLLGTIDTLNHIPPTQVANQQQSALITNLEHAGATHIYSDYWTCDLLVFLSNEKIICGVIGYDLRQGVNRYEPYYALVSNDPHSSYVLVAGSPMEKNFEQKMATTNIHYQRFAFDGYVVYQPVST